MSIDSFNLFGAKETTFCRSHIERIKFSIFDRATFKWEEAHSCCSTSPFRSFMLGVSWESNIFLEHDYWNLPLNEFVQIIGIDALHLINHVRFDDEHTASLVIQLYLLQSNSTVADFLAICPDRYKITTLNLL